MSSETAPPLRQELVRSGRQILERFRQGRTSAATALAPVFELETAASPSVSEDSESISTVQLQYRSGPSDAELAAIGSRGEQLLTVTQSASSLTEHVLTDRIQQHHQASQSQSSGYSLQRLLNHVEAAMGQEPEPMLKAELASHAAADHRYSFSVAAAAETIRTAASTPPPLSPCLPSGPGAPAAEPIRPMSLHEDAGFADDALLFAPGAADAATETATPGMQHSAAMANSSALASWLSRESSFSSHTTTETRQAYSSLSHHTFNLLFNDIHLLRSEFNALLIEYQKLTREKETIEERIEESWRAKLKEQFALEKKETAALKEKLAAQRAVLENEKYELEAERAVLCESQEELAVERDQLEKLSQQLDERGMVQEQGMQRVQVLQEALTAERQAIQEGRSMLEEMQDKLLLQQATLATDQASLQTQSQCLDSDRNALTSAQRALENEKSALADEKEACGVARRSLESERALLAAEKESMMQGISSEREMLMNEKQSVARDAESLVKERETFEGQKSAQSLDLEATRAMIEKERSLLELQKKNLEADRLSLAGERERLLAQLKSERAELQSEWQHKQGLESSSLAAEYTSLDAYRRTLESERESIRQYYESEKSELNYERHSLDEQFTKLEYEKSAFERIKENLAEQGREIQQERGALESEKTALAHERTKLREERSEFDAERGIEMELLQAEKESVRTQKSNLSTEKLTVEREKSSLAAERSTLAALKLKLDTEKSALAADKLSLSSETSAFEKERLEFAARERKQLAHEKDLTALESSLQAREAELQSSEERMSAQKQALHALEQTLTVQKEQLDERSMALDVLNSTLNARPSDALARGGMADEWEDTEDDEDTDETFAVEIERLHEQINSQYEICQGMDLKITSLKAEFARAKQVILDQCAKFDHKERELAERESKLHARENEMVAAISAMEDEHAAFEARQARSLSSSLASAQAQAQAELESNPDAGTKSTIQAEADKLRADQLVFQSRLEILQSSIRQLERERQEFETEKSHLAQLSSQAGASELQQSILDLLGSVLVSLASLDSSHERDRAKMMRDLRAAVSLVEAAPKHESAPVSSDELPDGAAEQAGASQLCMDLNALLVQLQQLLASQPSLSSANAPPDVTLVKGIREMLAKLAPNHDDSDTEASLLVSPIRPGKGRLRKGPDSDPEEKEHDSLEENEESILEFKTPRAKPGAIWRSSGVVKSLKFEAPETTAAASLQSPDLSVISDVPEPVQASPCQESLTHEGALSFDSPSLADVTTGHVSYYPIPAEIAGSRVRQTQRHASEHLDEAKLLSERVHQLQRELCELKTLRKTEKLEILKVLESSKLQAEEGEMVLFDDPSELVLEAISPAKKRTSTFSAYRSAQTPTSRLSALLADLQTPALKQAEERGRGQEQEREHGHQHEHAQEADSEATVQAALDWVFSPSSPQSPALGAFLNGDVIERRLETAITRSSNTLAWLDGLQSKLNHHSAPSRGIHARAAPTQGLDSRFVLELKKELAALMREELKLAFERMDRGSDQGTMAKQWIEKLTGSVMTFVRIKTGHVVSILTALVCELAPLSSALGRLRTACEAQKTRLAVLAQYESLYIVQLERVTLLERDLASVQLKMQASHEECTHWMGLSHRLTLELEGKENEIRDAKSSLEGLAAAKRLLEQELRECKDRANQREMADRAARLAKEAAPTLEQYWHMNDEPLSEALALVRSPTASKVAFHPTVHALTAHSESCLQSPQAHSDRHDHAHGQVATDSGYGGCELARRSYLKSRYWKARARRETGYRSDLIYQKKYLLLAVSSLQSSEQVTLELLSRFSRRAAPQHAEEEPASGESSGELASLLWASLSESKRHELLLMEVDESHEERRMTLKRVALATVAVFRMKSLASKTRLLMSNALKIPGAHYDKPWVRMIHA